MIELKLLKIEVRFMPRLWLCLGIVDRRSILLALAGVAVKVGRR